MDLENLVDLMIETATLKRMPRTGWGMRGVSPVESVADHSFGVGFVALVLADALPDQDLDLEKVLAMALLHDLGEVRLTDLPATAARLVPAEIKRRAESVAVSDLLSPLNGSKRLEALWHEFEDKTSPEGRLVRDADKLEMMIQCLRYELAGSRGLDEFWQSMDRHTWFFSVSAQFYAHLKGLRPEEICGHGTA